MDNGTSYRQSHIIASSAPKERRAQAEEVAERVRAKYAGEFKRTGWLGRIALRSKINREIHREFEKIVSNKAV